MGYSRAQKIESRERILGLAASQIKERGLESLAISDIMQQAGLTQGAFYGHFSSREDLLVAALRRARESGFTMLPPPEGASLGKILEIYLSVRHVTNPATGCTVAALASDARHASQAVRGELFASHADLVKYLQGILRDKSRAVGIASAMIGAVSTARLAPNKKAAQSILDETRRAILRG